jgi:xanthine dehydrogenase YagS FAD-binding subunit
MRAFIYQHAATSAEAIQAAAAAHGSTTNGGMKYLAGGTTLVDLMKLDVMQPGLLVDINALDGAGYGNIEVRRNGLRLGALVRMGDAADHAEIQNEYPVIAQSLKLAASPQIRNMASLGGNVLQRTRCNYFRDVSYQSCNKRNPGSGCAAMDGVNRQHAVLGISDRCIASYPGDFAQALIALDAAVEIAGPTGTRIVPFSTLHREPGETPDIETILQTGEMIASFMVPAGPWTRRSLFLKVRDRESYEFALASAAVALDMQGPTVRTARLALGGVATVPWRARAAEAVLEGREVSAATVNDAAEAAFEGARTQLHNAFKIELGKRTLSRALHQAAALTI